jgi:hypothetical protein
MVILRPLSITVVRSSNRSKRFNPVKCFYHNDNGNISSGDNDSTIIPCIINRRDTSNIGRIRRRRIGSCSIIRNNARTFSSASVEDETSDNQRRNHVEPIYKMEVDFFGEPVSFFVSDSADISPKVMGNVMGALNGGLLAAISKGLSCTHGGDEAGLEMKSTHASAVIWTELLRFAAVWNQGSNSNSNQLSSLLSCPMLAVIAVAPILVNTGIAYVRHIDTLLKHTKRAAPGLPPVQMYDIATNAAKCRNNKGLDPREKLHLQALHLLLKGDYQTALLVYLSILKSCPGDVLALSLLMDLSQTLGDKTIAYT